MQLARLNTWTLFIEESSDVQVVNRTSGQSWRVARELANLLKSYSSFRPVTEETRDWLTRGVLLAPFGDRQASAPHPAEEGQLVLAWQRWYWSREVESERDYHWLGHVVQKMPDDLFFYQEALFRSRGSAVLELGYGRGGGLLYFASILALLGGGVVVGVDHAPHSALPPFSTFPTVRVLTVNGDAHAEATLAIVSRECSLFDLIVVDSSAVLSEQRSLLARWAPLLREGGCLAIEDASAATAAGAHLSDLLDDFLLENRDFGISVEALRHPFLKSAGAILTRKSGLQ